jgi:DNA-binding NarL/FixJ family response regulator
MRQSSALGDRLEHDRAITVLVGEFGAVIGRGLGQILGEDRELRVAGTGLAQAELEAAVANCLAQVAILDESTVADPSVVARLRARRPDLGLLVLAHRPTRAYTVRLFAFGVTACLPKDASARDILRAIRLAADGTHVFATCVDRSSNVMVSGGIASLTPREREVLKLLSAGRANGAIAHALQISLETARTHVAHIYRQLGVSARTELLGIDSDAYPETGAD